MKSFPTDDDSPRPDLVIGHFDIRCRADVAAAGGAKTN